MKGLLPLVRALVDPVLHRVKTLAIRGVVRHVDDAPLAMELQVATARGETSSKVPRFGHFGFHSHPPVGSEAIVLHLGGSRELPVVIADEDRRERPAGTLEAGEVGLYAAGGARLYLRADGSVEIVAPGGVTITGDVEVAGSIEASGDVADGVGTLAALRTGYNAHTHLDPQGGSTGPPNPTVP